MWDCCIIYPFSKKGVLMEYKLRIIFRRSLESKSVSIVGYKLFEFGMHLNPPFQTGIYFLECDTGYGGHMHVPVDNVAYIEEMVYRDKEKDTTAAGKTPGHLVN